MARWRATKKVAALPFMRLPVGMAIFAGAWLLALAVLPFLGAASIVGVAGVTWGGGMLLGLVLRTLLRAETLLLPNFHRHLAAAGAIYVLILLVLPALLAQWSAPSAHSLALCVSVLAVALAFGISTGAGVQVTMFVWILFPIVGLLPKSIYGPLAQLVVHSPWVPVLLLLVAAGLLEFTLRPLLETRDREADESPMQAVADGRKPTGTGSSGTPKRRGKLGKKLTAILNATAEKNLTRALATFARKPGPRSRLRLIRAVVLPHDNPVGIAINIAAVSLIAALWFVLTDPAQDMSVGFLAGYAMVLGTSRFSAVGRGMLKMRPNLADLYMMLGPLTHREFQSVMMQTLLWLVTVTLINMLAFTVLVAVLLHASHPGQLLLATLIVGPGVAFACLGAHLVGPTSRIGRGLMQMVLSIIALGLYMLVWALMQHVGLLIGVAVAVLVCLPAGVGSWFWARGRYLQRRPCFDAPLD